jgi:hypothetical protein
VLVTVIPQADVRMMHEASAHDRSPKTPKPCGPPEATTDATTTEREEQELREGCEDGGGGHEVTVAMV